MHKLLLALFFLISTIYGQAQPKGIDSLMQVLPMVPDSSRLSTNFSIANAYLRHNYDSASKYVDISYAIALQKNDKNKMAAILNLKGVIAFLKANYSDGISIFNEALVLSKELEDSARISNLYNGIGLCYTYMANYDTAVNYLKKAETIRLLTNDPKLSSTVNNVGIVYYKMQDLDKALIYYKKAAILKKKHNQRGSLANTLNNIGIILKNQGKPEEAIPYYLESLSLAEEFNDKKKQGNAHNNLAELYVFTNNKDSAEVHFKQAIELKKQLHDNTALLNSYNNYANLLTSNSQFLEAGLLINKADSLNDLIGLNMWSSKNLLAHAHFYKAKGNYIKALDYTNRAWNIRVDAMNEDRNEKIAELEVRFETAQKEAELEQAQLKNELQENKLQEANFQLIVILLLSIITVGFVITFYFLKSKKAIAERLAQDLQVDALKQRLLELQFKHEGAHTSVNLTVINEDLPTPLTDRECEALKLSLKGHTNNEIAEKLFVSINTVKFHLRNIYQKLGVSNKKEVVEYVAKSS